MRLNLHSLILAPAILAAAAVTTQTASAAVLHVPFSFTVSGKALPAGEYRVNGDLRGNFVTLTTPDGKQSFNWMIVPGEPAPGSQGVVLKFDPTAEGYALHSIQYNALATPQLDKKQHLNEDRPVHTIRGE
ncbi:hypothetical protein DYQ86_07985 [Acidobacteria bacterium AB60]|nr:hypothetical protein DYQ86_07985 [Acidobacteria bacterium AB60]